MTDETQPEFPEPQELRSLSLENPWLEEDIRSSSPIQDILQKPKTSSEPNKPKYVHIQNGKETHQIRYESVWCSSPNGIKFSDTKGSGVWTPCKYIDQSILPSVALKEWNRNKSSNEIAAFENDLRAKAIECIRFYADPENKNKRLSEQWWTTLRLGWNIIAASRDYHDFRIAYTNKKLHMYLESISPNLFRDYNHFFRIWNCLVFTSDFRTMVEFWDNGCNYTSPIAIPKSVRQILLEGSKADLINENELTELITMIKKNRF